MDIYKIATILLFLSALFESSFIGFPLVLVLSIILFLISDSKKTLAYIFAACFILDSSRAQQVGMSALFVFATLLFIDFYKRSFEVRDIRHILIINFIATFVYAKIFGYGLFFLW